MQNDSRVFVMTDSNSGIRQAEGEKYQIGVIPMPFFIDGEEFFEDVSITREEFFKKMEEGAEISTSQPSPESLMNKWEEALKTYESVVYIPMSSGLSGSLQTAKMLAQEYDGRVFVVDNQRISVTMKQSVLEAKYLADHGWSGKDICDLLEKHGLEASIYIAVDTLKYLKKGGRVTAAGAAVGTVLNIKPVLQIQGEKLDAFAKVRGTKAAQERMLKAIEDDMNGRFAGRKVMIKGAYTCSDEEAEKWLQKVKERFPDYEVSVDPLSLSISTHIGPGATAVTITEVLDEAPEIHF